MIKKSAFALAANLIAVGSTMLFASQIGFAQGAPTQLTAAPADERTPASPWTAAQVPPNDPFGTIKVDPSADNATAVKSFFAGLDSGQKSEMENRCIVVVQQNYIEHYPAGSYDFCNYYLRDAMG